MDITRGTLLGGLVAHEQPALGHRTGLEPVLLAASVPARTGQTVLEGGTGSGAGLLCLAARVTGLRGTGVEIAAEMAELARRNLAANTFAAGIEIATADLLTYTTAREVDHAFANPPWHDGSGTPSPDAHKTLAKRAAPDGIADWVAALARQVRPSGTVSLVVPAAVLPPCLEAFAASACGGIVLYPLWPRQGRAAKLMLVQAVKGGRGPCRVLAGMVLHAGSGSSFTETADAVLRSGAAISLSDRLAVGVPQAP